MGLNPFEGRADLFFHFVEKSGLEGFTKKGIVKMFHNAPKAVVGEPAFGNQAMNVRIPFKRASESMKNTDKAGNKVFGLVYLEKHTKNDTADGTE